jgi:hypothetical protein
MRRDAAAFVAPYVRLDRLSTIVGPLLRAGVHGRSPRKIAMNTDETTWGTQSTEMATVNKARLG